MNDVVKILRRSIATGRGVVRGVAREVVKAGRQPVGLVAVAALVVSLAAGPLLVSEWRKPEAEASVLLSLNRPVKASSQMSAVFAAGQAVDGVSGTRWASVVGADPQWITVDLGAVYRITRVVLSWEAAHAAAYQVQASVDGDRWASLYATSDGGGGIERLLDLTGSGRYVRVLGTRRATSSGYSLWELSVFGVADPVLVARPPFPADGQPSTSVLRPHPQQLSTEALASPVTRLALEAGSSAVPRPATGAGLREPARKDVALRLVSSAENSSLDWKAQYAFIRDIGDGRGYTAGVVGFCSGTGDMLEVVARYSAAVPGNVLAAYLPALRRVNGGASHAGLDPGFPDAWRAAANDPRFRRVQDAERDEEYFDPAVGQAERDGLRELGQFIYFDAMIMHGPGSDPTSFGGIRQAAMSQTRTPAQGGNEVSYLTAFLQARRAVMRQEASHSDTSRVDTAQLLFLRAGNLGLNPPLRWQVYGDSYSIP